MTSKQSDRQEQQQGDMATYTKRSWKKSILNQLRSRNQREITPFQDLINVHNKIVERISSLQTENTQLNYINEKLKEEIQNLKISIPDSAVKSASNAIGGSSAEAIAAQSTITELQKKLFKVQEELTELHRRKGKDKVKFRWR